MKTSPLICSANQWTGLYMITTSVMKDLIGLKYRKKRKKMREKQKNSKKKNACKSVFIHLNT